MNECEFLIGGAWLAGMILVIIVMDWFFRRR